MISLRHLILTITRFIVRAGIEASNCYTWESMRVFLQSFSYHIEKEYSIRLIFSILLNENSVFQCTVCS